MNQASCWSQRVCAAIFGRGRALPSSVFVNGTHTVLPANSIFIEGGRGLDLLDLLFTG